jgi:hypothetical protein
MKARGLLLILSLMAMPGPGLLGESARPGEGKLPTGFVGREQCVACHADIGKTQMTSDHALSARKLDALPELLKALPLRYADKANEIDYSLDRSANHHFELVATKDGQTDRLELLWAFGSGRKGISFVGRAAAGQYGQARLSWYASIRELDITPGSKAKVKDANDALADWFEPGKREECFNCHVSHQSERPPEEIAPEHAGIQCERCHGPGQGHLQAVAQGRKPGTLAIRHPGRATDEEQYRFCGECHRLPPASFDAEAFDKIVRDPVSVRFPARRLVLSRCFNEGTGQLKCTLCHNPHGQLAVTAADYDSKCIACHAAANPKQSHCSVSKKDCVTCHLTRESLTKHLDFADHWIRVVRVGRPKN